MEVFIKIKLHTPEHSMDEGMDGWDTHNRVRSAGPEVGLGQVRSGQVGVLME